MIGRASQGMLIGLAWLCAGAGSAMAADWIGAWGASPEPVAPSTPAFAGVTLRQVVRLSAGGEQLRLRLSNEFGAASLRIGEAHVALVGPDGAIVPGTDRPVAFGGQASAAIPPGAPLVSDPVALKVPPLASLAVSLYLPEPTGRCTCHLVGLATGAVSGPGDFAGAAQFPAKATFGYRAFLSGVDVRPERPGKTIVALGDSLTDGVGSTPDQNRRWPDRLAERLYARDGERRAWGVVDAGIGGNRLVSDSDTQNALARLDRDGLSAPGAAYLILFQGVNDLGAALAPSGVAPVSGPPAPPLTAADLIAADLQVIARAHLRGLKVIGATVTPYGGAFYYSPAGEAERQTLNAWIRTSGAFDGVADFDAAWRDPADPTRIRPEFDAGDHLHGNDAGYRALGDAIELGVFR